MKTLDDVIADCIARGYIAPATAKALTALAQKWSNEGQAHVRDVIARGVLRVPDIELFRYWEKQPKEPTPAEE